MNNQKKIDYKIKYLKYKNKYNKLKLSMTGSSSFLRATKKNSEKICNYHESDERKPSNCDRIIYKSKSPIITKKYQVINDINFDLIKLSDHKMIFAELKFNSKDFLIFSWNMGAFDKDLSESKELISIGIHNFIKKYIIPSTKKIYDYIIFSFQESIKESIFIKDLTKQLIDNKQMPYHLILHETSNPNFSTISSTSKYNVQLLIFSKDKLNIDDKNKGYNNFKLSDQSIFKQVKTLLGTKSFVWGKINDLTIVSTHFPIDTADKETLGNKLRISALDEIKNKFINENNILIIGDLNFRNLNSFDQLSLLLANDNTLKEVGTLNEPTCKYENCKLSCKKESCNIVGK